jgi:cytochrome c peroxidase
VPLAESPGEPLRPLPLKIEGDPLEVALGRDLFFEPKLSRGGGMRCVDCHQFANGGADPRSRSVGTDGQEGPVQALSVFNLVFDNCYNWDGKTCDLAAHAELPLFNMRVMGMTADALVPALTGDYAGRFAAVYSDGLTVANVTRALAAYERTLITPNAPIDRYLRGEVNALGPEALAGYRIFKELGCASCHQGTNIGGNLFQRFGVLGDPTADRGGAADEYAGRQRATGREEDRGVFRVPSLRNVGLTAPYFHDASAKTLGEAVAIMARYQLGHRPTPGETAALVAFLEALTGELPEVPDGR